MPVRRSTSCCLQACLSLSNRSKRVGVLWLTSWSMKTVSGISGEIWKSGTKQKEVFKCREKQSGNKARCFKDPVIIWGHKCCWQQPINQPVTLLCPNVFQGNKPQMLHVDLCQKLPEDFQTQLNLFGTKLTACLLVVTTMDQVSSEKCVRFQWRLRSYYPVV